MTTNALLPLITFHELLVVQNHRYRYPYIIDFFNYSKSITRSLVVVLLTEIPPNNPE